MKRTGILIAATILALSCSAAHAANQSIRTNPLSYIVGAFNAEYEKAITKDSTLGIGGAFASYDLGFVKASGFSVSPVYRKYLKGQALDGFYVGGSATASFIGAHDATTAVGNVGLSAEGLGGVRWVAKNGFTSDLNVGINMGLLNGVKVSPAFGFSFGYTW